jgi:hypothetical protein
VIAPSSAPRTRPRQMRLKPHPLIVRQISPPHDQNNDPIVVRSQDPPDRTQCASRRAGMPRARVGRASHRWSTMPVRSARVSSSVHGRGHLHGCVLQRVPAAAVPVQHPVGGGHLLGEDPLADHGDGYVGGLAGAGAGAQCGLRRLR